MMKMVRNENISHKRPHSAVPICIAAAVLATIAPTNVEAQADQPVTISMFVAQDSGHGRVWFLKTYAIPEFQKKYPNIHVNLISVPWTQYDTKLSTMIGAGTPPDIFPDWGQSGFGDYYHRGLLADLTPLMKQTHWRNENVPKQLYDVLTMHGHLYALPYVFDASFLYYNKAIFKQAHVPVPNYHWNDPKWTWNAMVQVAKKLTSNYGKPNGTYGLVYANGVTDNTGWPWGVEIYTNKDVDKTGIPMGSNLTNPKVIQAFQGMQNLVYKDKVSPTPALSGALAGQGDPFLTGKVAMEVTGSWLSAGIKGSNLQVGVAPLPIGADGKATPAHYTSPLMISKDSKNKLSAWEFISFLTSKPMQAELAKEIGDMPADQTAANTAYAALEAHGVPASRLQEMYLANVRYGEESLGNRLAGYAQIYNFLTNNLGPINNTDSNVAQVLKTSNGTFDALLAQIRSKIVQS